MRRLHRRSWATVVGLALVATSELRSQINRSRANADDPSAADVAALLRAHARYGAAVAVLTQALRPQSGQKMDEIADTLLAIGMSFPGEDARGALTRSAALSALVLAGKGESNVAGVEHAMPYAGAADRIMRMADSAQDIGIRGAALQSLARLPHNAEILQFLRQVATSRNPVAHEAVVVLANETGAEGQAIAQELYKNKKIIDPYAKEIMAGVAKAYGWR